MDYFLIARQATAQNAPCATGTDLLFPVSKRHMFEHPSLRNPRSAPSDWSSGMGFMSR